MGRGLTTFGPAMPAAKPKVSDAKAAPPAPASLPPPSATRWDPAWSRFAGLYRGRNGDSRVVELNQRLVIVSSTSTNLDDLVRLEPLGDGTFRYTGSTGGGPVGEIVRFVEENGRVTRMITGDSYVDRVQQ